MTFIRVLTTMIALGAGQIAPAADEAVVPPSEFVYCTVCHGMQLMGNQNIEAPRLSQMDTWYVEQQLRAFRQGYRGTHPDDLIGMEMRPMAEALSEKQVVSAAAFVNKTRSPLPAATIDGDASAGKTHFAACSACHGANAEGNQALGAPALSGLNDWYLLTQLRHFRDGIRGASPADVYGQQMRASVQLLADDQAMQDVVKYITTIQTD